MTLTTRLIQKTEANEWDLYVHNHLDATLYHLYGWKNVIENTYGHNTYYIVAENTDSTSQTSIVGVLPLVHMKHFIFGNQLISIPFFDMAGILADSPKAEQALLSEAIRICEKLKAATIELRQTKPLSSFNPKTPIAPTTSIQSHKVRMLLELPDSPDTLMASFKSKLRSQIKKPMKEGLYAKIGGLELLDDFYAPFAVNMRDLGSPVHSKSLMHAVLQEFAKKGRLVVVYSKDACPIAGALVVGFGNTLENPWASSLRRYSRLSPNMLLYWSMLSYACENKYRFFDFGRSTPEEGTYKFKVQWGARPEPFFWHSISFNGKRGDSSSDRPVFNTAIRYWKKMPVSVTKILGPMIRKHIGL